ncbi:hypothetical protein [Pseudomonas neuropathica]|uniref:Uncharacterized protein n=1 Tax=Pseudomonas neuropathica TaxID=2730425 RepID=A0ACC7N2M8_9PSED
MRNGVFEILALGDRFSAAYKSIESTISEFGTITFREEGSFQKADEAITFVRNSSFDMVIMPNPYGNERRRWIYTHLKTLGFPVLVFDRGALPGSWFFDLGFNADSATYHPLTWDKPLTEEENEAVNIYIEEAKTHAPLENQAPAIGGSQLKEDLGLTGKKVLFVPFQRPSDTTIKFFSGQVASFDNFVKLVSKTKNLLQQYSDEWVIVAKKHPLEQNRPSADVMYVDDDTHIHDLIEMSEAVLLVNSGVGVISALFNKPVLHAGHAFYSHPNINHSVNTAEDIAYWLHSGFKPCENTRNRFIHHLVNNVYSFGKFETELVQQKDGSYRNITRKIHFDKVNVPQELKKKRTYSL